MYNVLKENKESLWSQQSTQTLFYHIEQRQEIMTLDKLPYTTKQIIQNVLHLLMAMNIFPMQEFEMLENVPTKTYPTLMTFICCLNLLELRNTSGQLWYLVPMHNMYIILKEDVASESGPNDTVATITAAGTTGGTLGNTYATSTNHPG
jgi:hypothetical protein